jgi:beta-N-acetylhexosaminidase
MISKTLKTCLLLFCSVYLAFSKNCPDNTPFKNIDTSWVDSVFNQMTNDERIAQMLMPAIYINDSAQQEGIFDNIQKIKPGGILIFKGGPVRTAFTINKLQSLSKVPLLMGVDGEWGLAMRLDSTIAYPRQMMMGAISDDTLIYQMASDITKQLKRLGLHTNFAPVIDINNNPNNPVISSRSFGETPEKVFSYGNIYMKGLQNNHILSTAKHFPGHGDTETDSHMALPSLRQTYARIDSFELIPYKKLINNNLTGVMVAHLNLPALDSSGVPASLSPIIDHGLLRDSLGFEGLIITDGLNMKGVAEGRTQKEIAIKCFQAGNDILLMPDDINSFFDTIKAAAEKGIISYDEIYTRCKRILMAKCWLGLNKYNPVELNNIYNDLSLPEYELTRRKIIENAITVISNKNNILPIKNIDTLRMACVSFGTKDTGLFQTISALYTPLDFYGIDRDASDSTYIELLARLKNYNLVIAAITNTDMRYSKKFGVTDKSIQYLGQLADSVKTILNVFASPYILARLNNPSVFEAIILSYEDKPVIQDISAQMIFGAIAAKGSLPVTASAKISCGTGIHWDSTFRVKYTIPEELGIDSKKLFSIDSLVNDAIRQHATPGCVVYWAKDNKVFYHKAFGHFNYDSIRKVKTSDIYDIASITKIVATTPAIMRLYEQKKINLDARISKYIPKLRRSNKKKIHVIDILTHQAQLQPIIPLYLQTLECKAKDSFGIPLPMFKNGKKKNGISLIPTCITTYKDGIYSNYYNNEFNIQVADTLYVSNKWEDSLLTKIKTSELLPSKIYKYSDIGFILMGMAIERITKQNLNIYSNNNFYKPLGANTLTYIPIYKFSKEILAPTENDTIFRKQQIQGFVHDPTAAILGGICGHAGLFSNANDLGKMMHIFLNKGSYGGKQYFNPSTIEFFTSRPFNKNENRRAIGFDKPEPDTSKTSPVSRYCSNLSYGHTGFTGTMTWVDPKYGLVFVFLSNRVCPDAGENKLADINLRSKIQDIVYQEIINKEIKK